MKNVEDIEILLVEDSPEDAEVVIRALGKRALASRLKWVKDGAAALDFVRAQESHPKVVLLDIKLPKVDGLEVLTAVRADPRTRSLPIVVMTSSTQEEDVAEAYRLGANSFVSKPVKFEEFAQVASNLGLYWLLINRPLERWSAAVDATRAVMTTQQPSRSDGRRKEDFELRRLNAELEQRVAERTAELEAVTREMQAFAYSISHDLKAPLRCISGFCEALLEEDAARLDDQGRARLARVAAGAKLMTKLVDDLLRLARVSNAPVKIQRVDVSAMAREIVGELRENEPGRAVEFSVADGLVASADAQLLRIALNDLIDNAWKYTGKTPHARIEIGSTPRPDGTAICFVRDNGAGFEMEYVGKLFIPFQRLHGASEFPGSGMGLAIVKRAIGRLGGRVWAEGRPGDGATFFFSVPVAAGGTTRGTS
ncbi:MAG TPA: response regulator [Verrucomicrobiae bacterium]|nr:response regulator [Verrucomicrobiae bacterium]